MRILISAVAFASVASARTAGTSINPKQASISPEPSNNACIFGKSMEIENQLLKSDDPILKIWREVPPTEDGYRTQTPIVFDNCSLQETNGGLTTNLNSDPVKKFGENLFGNVHPQKFMSLECVSEGVHEMEFLPDRVFCATETGQPKDVSSPCITKNYVSYVHWLANSVVACLSPQPKSFPIDTQILFSKILQESSFAATLSNSSGTGLVQLVAEGFSVFQPPNSAGKGAGEGYGFLLDLLEQNNRNDGKRAACPLYNELKQIVMGGVKKNARVCQLSQMGRGLARNLTLGIGLFLYYRDSDYLYSAKTRLAKLGYYESHPDYPYLANRLALLGYNAPQLLNLASSPGRLPRAGAKGFNAAKFFNETIRKNSTFHYYDEIADRSERFLETYPEAAKLDCVAPTLPPKPSVPTAPAVRAPAKVEAKPKVATQAPTKAKSGAKK